MSLAVYKLFFVLQYYLCLSKAFSLCSQYVKRDSRGIENLSINIDSSDKPNYNFQTFIVHTSSLNINIWSICSSERAQHVLLLVYGESKVYLSSLYFFVV